jgi:hypothetical protein
MEEMRIRAATLLSKVFLHHLTPLLSLPTFTALWLTILDFMDRYMHVDKSDLLVSVTRLVSRECCQDIQWKSFRTLGFGLCPEI